MTLNDLERRARKLLYRRKLAEKMDELEYSIKAWMRHEAKQKITTNTLVIRLAGDELVIAPLPDTDPKQLKLWLEKDS